MALCGILLCITGSEAMFAGLGHFSQLSIKGLIVSSRKNSLQHFKKPWAHEQEPINSLLEAIKVEKGLSKDDKAQKLPLRHWLEPQYRTCGLVMDKQLFGYLSVVEISSILCWLQYHFGVHMSTSY
ncbi:hypothetical protein GLYMA_01G088850v4 [Glycine max]|nr:hypothetical protein GLYMA_01G088850v4 [Glycine max]KAH1162268.1 hypothetical protein GYH30_000953 [Glycine max]